MLQLLGDFVPQTPYRVSPLDPARKLLSLRPLTLASFPKFSILNMPLTFAQTFYDISTVLCLITDLNK